MYFLRLCFLKTDLHIENYFAFIHCKNYHIITFVSLGTFEIKFTKLVKYSGGFS